MAVVGKCTTGMDIVNGLAVAMGGDGRPLVTNTFAEQGSGMRRWGSGDSLNTFQVLDTRYRHKGGVDGSGKWEWE